MVISSTPTATSINEHHMFQTNAPRPTSYTSHSASVTAPCRFSMQVMSRHKQPPTAWKLETRPATIKSRLKEWKLPRCACRLPLQRHPPPSPPAHPLSQEPPTMLTPLCWSRSSVTQRRTAHRLSLKGRKGRRLKLASRQQASAPIRCPQGLMPPKPMQRHETTTRGSSQLGEMPRIAPVLPSRRATLSRLQQYAPHQAAKKTRTGLRSNTSPLGRCYLSLLHPTSQSCSCSYLRLVACC